MIVAVPTEMESFLRERIPAGPLGSDELLHLLLPLFEQVAQAHRDGKIAPLDGIVALRVAEGRAFFSISALASAKGRSSVLRELERDESRALDIVSYAQVDETEPGGPRFTDLSIRKDDAPLTRPVFLLGYRCWEHEVGHHDPVTDIFSLGLLLASFACAVDLRDPDDLERFVRFRETPASLNQRLHPVMGRLITRMTALSRRERAQDLPAVLSTFKNYRDQRIEAPIDLRTISGFQVEQRKDPRQLIQARLRERLFEITRRNRLLYFKPSLSTLNLTLASVPLLLDYKSISPDALFTWQGSVADALSHEKPVPLGRYLRFEDALYIPSVLDKIRAEDRRNRAEFGFSQLRLAIAFLRWHNLKGDDKDERITSPLILLPVTLEKRKGVRDSYVVTPATDVAEVNPVLRYLLRETYGIDLPEAIDLGIASPQTLFETLRDQITASEPGVHLRLIERPQIRLVHERAKARLEQYRRSSRVTGGRMRSYGAIDYSYSNESFRPLGLQLFLQRIRPAPLPAQSFLDVPTKPDVPMSMVSDATIERDAYAHVDGDSGGPYNWDFDLCTMTLGNFQYRKISLVRDYNLLLDRNGNGSSSRHPVFDAIFSLVPRSAEEEKIVPPALRELPTVVPADPTQVLAIGHARRKDSYIIQGPPGTGKSQTITNLIADFVARGKRVLFVCEKRAAIDVVYYRLKQCGLDHLCALIHDSQADKKEFILGLKAVSDRYLHECDEFEALDRARADLLTRLETELGALDRFAAAMLGKTAKHALVLRGLLDRSVALADEPVALGDSEAERLPGYAEWIERQAILRELARTLAECGGPKTLATHPLRWLQRACLLAERPLQAVSSGLEEQVRALARVKARLGSWPLDEATLDLRRLGVLSEYLALVRPVAEAGLERLLSDDAAFAELRTVVKQVAEADAALATASSHVTAWREKIPPAEIDLALEQARSVKGAFGVFKPTWWRLRKVLRQRYDFAKHAVRPGWVTILETLKTFYDAESATQRAGQAACDAYGTPQPKDLLAQVEETRKASARFREARALLGTVATPVLKELLPFADEWAELAGLQHRVVRATSDDNLGAVARRLADVREALPSLPELLPHLSRLATDASDELWWALGHFDRTPDGIEAIVLQAAIRDAYRSDRSLMRMTGPILAEHAARVAEAEQGLRELHARWLAAKVHMAFRQNIARSEIPAAQLSSEQREWKKQYTRGRRELEHEFAKVMRYRSIRELATGESGLVIRDLKPVWLMSPLSVSDTLPLENDSFDVVIYDEASQIPSEEAMPALYRAPQAIVVGDRQQLPPTDFFSTRMETDSDEESPADEEDVGFELDADSFLTQAAGTLPSTMLSWHYRSRSEALISFSNAAFYQGHLLTIPDSAIAARRPAIEVRSPDDGFANADRILDRPVSFHRLGDAPYVERRNPAEATYIAQLLRGLLAKGAGHSIGIVAFSVAQQGQIESALEDLAGRDPDFRERLESEYTREEDDQFCGLFVKNLENVQGDERDIIVVSICYGPDPDGKMLMNFGPINKSGGERRLNVVFSRAKRHMVVVSSIRHTAITNEYNDGANCLRRYLEFSAAASVGDAAATNRVLEACCPDLSRIRRRAEAADAVTGKLAQALVSRGLLVETGVGASHFRCDLAVRRSGDARHLLGILVDNEHSYATTSSFERWIERPRLLAAANWRPMLVLAKDVHSDLRAVVGRIERALET
jgi:ABC-type iron transport system FetAB ATPase subunit